MGLQEIISGKARKVLYAIYAFVGLGLTATSAGLLAAGETDPKWILVAYAVYGVVGSGFGFTAAANVVPVGEVQPRYDNSGTLPMSHQPPPDNPPDSAEPTSKYL